MSRTFKIWLEQDQVWKSRFTDESSILSFIRSHTDRGTRIGKILSKMRLWSSEDVQYGVLAWNAPQYIANVEIVSDYDTILTAYTDVHSCMSKDAESTARFFSHPILTDQDVRLAIYRQHGRITARCLIYKDTRLEIYSTGNFTEFTMALKELGIRSWMDTQRRVISDKKLPLLDFIPYLDELGDHCNYAKDPDLGWFFVFPDNWRSYEELLERLTDRIELCGFKIKIDTLKICTSTEELTWRSIHDYSDL